MPGELVGTTLGPYHIQKDLNRGGMATVYQGVHTARQVPVAIKVLPVYFAHDPQFLKRFRREARAAVTLKHPHIVRVYDSGEAQGVPYIVMEYVPGGTLKDLLERESLPLARIALVIRQVADALDYAHRQGIVHRDVKPSNVLVAAPDIFKLSDFGIAKTADDDSGLTALTGTGVSVGTAAYMAPEQALEAASADQRADIYSLGVMLYLMVSGKLPYNADTPMGLLAQHIYEPVPAVRRDRPGLPEALEHILLKAMAKDPDARFQSAPELAARLDDVLARRPVSIDVELPPPLPDEPTGLIEETAGVGLSAPPPPTVVEPAMAIVPDDTASEISDLLSGMKRQHRTLFRAALAAYDLGNLDSSRRLLMQILRLDDRVAPAWLLLSYLEENWYDQKQCADNALAVAPEMEDARLRVEQLEAERLPATFGRMHSVIPAVKEAHDAAMDAYFQQSELETPFGDPLDDPNQCPYCGVVNDAGRNTCAHCKNNMMRQQKLKREAIPALRLAFALNLGAVVLVLLQLFPPLLWTWYIGIPDNTRMQMFIGDVFATRMAKLVAGDFTAILTPTLFLFLVGAGIVRIILLLAVQVGLRWRSSWAYYGGLFAFALELVWGALALALGWTGIFVGVIAALIAVGGLFSLGAASVNFGVNTERIRVLPEGKLKSGKAFWELGKQYQRNGLWAMAVAQYRAAVAAAPNRAEHYKSLGIGYNKLGRTDRALPALEQAARLDPTDLETMVLLKRLRQEREAGAAGQTVDRAGAPPSQPLSEQTPS